MCAPAAHEGHSHGSTLGTLSYNYEHFDTYVDDGREATEFAAFPNHLHVGDVAPDCVLTVLDDGRSERLSQRWRARAVVIEFGSFT